MKKLPTTNGVNNFHFIAIAEHLIWMLTARHYLAVQFYRESFASQSLFNQKVGNRAGLIKLLGLVVDGNRDQCKWLGTETLKSGMVATKESPSSLSIS